MTDDKTIDEVKLLEMLKVAELPKKPSYNMNEVCLLFGISERTFRRLTCDYEKDTDTGEPVQPYSLDSYMLAKSRRVRFNELVEFLARNNTYERLNAL
jgi:hypothetical protein